MNDRWFGRWCWIKYLQLDFVWFWCIYRVVVWVSRIWKRERGSIRWWRWFRTVSWGWRWCFGCRGSWWCGSRLIRWSNSYRGTCLSKGGVTYEGGEEDEDVDGELLHIGGYCEWVRWGYYLILYKGVYKWVYNEVYILWNV